VTRLSPIFSFVLMLLAGLAGGLFVTYKVLELPKPPGAQRYGQWVSWLANNNNDFDPYSQAFFARRGDIPLTPLEGIALFASEDQDGKSLIAKCSYEISGVFPITRAWTLHAYTASGILLTNAAERSGFTSSEVVLDNGLTKILISSEPQPGNWMPSNWMPSNGMPSNGTPNNGTSSGNDQDFVLVLRFYESAFSSAGSLFEVGRLPSLRRVGCSP
jgi:hypothetical protein